jgi:hypothetical protein
MARSSGDIAGSRLASHLYRRSDLAVAALLLLAAFAYFAGTANLDLKSGEEGYFAYTTARVASGEVPHRDFVLIYGPGAFAVNAQLFRLFDGEILPIRYLLAALRAAAVALVYLIARHLVPLPFALVGGTLAAAYWGRVIWTLTTPYAALYTLPLCLLSAFLLLRGLWCARNRYFFWAGVASGAGLLFKQSLAAFFAYAMVLALCGSAMLSEGGSGAGGRHRAPILAGWAAAGLAIALPFLSTMSGVDYLLHFLPIHVLVALIGIHFARCGDGPAALSRAAPRVAIYALGFLAIPAAVASLYAYWGALGDLVHNMFVRPLQLRNYYLPVATPPLRSAAIPLSLAALIAAGLALLRRSEYTALIVFLLGTSVALLFRPLQLGHESLSVDLLPGGSLPVLLATLTLLAVGLVLMRLSEYAALALVPLGISLGLFATGRIGTWLGPYSDLTIAIDESSGVLPAAVAYCALILVGRPLLRSEPHPDGRHRVALIAVLFAQLAMAFQIFPRGGFSVTIMLGTLAPAAAYLLYRASRSGVPGEAPSGRTRRALALALVSLLPAAMVFPIVSDAVAQLPPGQREYLTLPFPATRGIRVSEPAYRRSGMAAAEWLVLHLRETEPLDAPLFLLSNDNMLPFLSGRERLFRDRSYFFYLMGWDMLPESDLARLDRAEMLRRLEAAADPFVIDRDDFSSENVRKYLPEIDRYLEESFRVAYRVGGYKVLRKRRSE